MNAITANAARPVKLLPLGACQVAGPTAALHESGRVLSAFAAAGYQSQPYLYTVKAAQQLVDVLAGKRTIPPHLARFSFLLTPVSGSGEAHSILAGNDLAIIEPNYPIDIVVESTVLSQQLLKRELTDPLAALGPDLKKQCYIWMKKGLLSQDEDARSAAAAALLEKIPRDMPGAPSLREVIRHARGLRSSEPQVAADVLRLRDDLGIPCALALYTYGYGEDGTPESQHAAFRVSIKKIAIRHGFPLLDLSGLVRRAGVEQALRPDRRHFRDAFLPVAARSVLYFLHKNRDRLGIAGARLARGGNSKAERHRHVEAARVAEDAGDLALALDHYRRMLEADPADLGALRGRRRVALRLGLVAEAYEAAAALARCEPHVPSHAIVLAKYAKLAAKPAAQHANLQTTS